MIMPVLIACKPSGDPEENWKHFPAPLNISSPTTKLIIARTLSELRRNGFDTATLDALKLIPDLKPTNSIAGKQISAAKKTVRLT